MAWLNLTMANQTVKNGLKAKKIKLPQMNFFLEKQLIKFSCTYWPLSFCKILKKFLGLIQSYEDVPICHEQFFLVQTIIITFIYLLALFIVQNLKKFFQRIQSYEDAQFLGPKWPISPNENFFRKPVNEPCFFYSCLSTCQKSKPDINLLMKCWWLKNTEISLTKTHFWL